MENFTFNIIDEIRKGAYEAYKINWLHTQLTKDQQLDVIKNYIEESIEAFTEYDNEPESLDDYIFENGYFGDCYVCFNEFLDSDYRDIEFMASLIGVKNLEYLINNDPVLEDLKDEFEKSKKELLEADRTDYPEL